MRLKGYGPVIAVIAVLAVLAAAQGIFSRTVQPEMLQSQVGGTENSLQDVQFFDLEIELVDDREIEIRYQARSEDSQTAEIRRGDRDEETLSGQEAVSGVQTIIESAPSLSTAEPLTLIQGLLDQLEIHQAEVKEFDLEYALSDGIERSIELDVDQDRANDDDDDDDDDDDAFGD
ncbi:MAG: YusW family protein [Limnochordia bacterium]|nr:YusW family protein [Limnochordia bacterium]